MGEIFRNADLPPVVEVLRETDVGVMPVPCWRTHNPGLVTLMGQLLAKAQEQCDLLE